MSVKINLELEKRISIFNAMPGGNKNSAFENWENSQLITKYTSFKSVEDLKHVLDKAGCDFKMNIQYYTTHFHNGYYDYVLWIEKNGNITAVYDIDDNEELVGRLFQKIEKETGKKCFYNSIEELAAKTKKPESKIKKTVEMVKGTKKPDVQKNEPKPEPKLEEKPKPKPKPITAQTFETRFADKNLLIKTLKSIGLDCIEKNDSIICSSDDYVLIFTNKDGSGYKFRITGTISNKEAYQKYKNINSKYTKIVQQEVIENIKQKTDKSPSMKLENEEILEDNSVLLTISLR